MSHCHQAYLTVTVRWFPRYIRRYGTGRSRSRRRRCPLFFLVDIPQGVGGEGVGIRRTHEQDKPYAQNSFDCDFHYASSL